jgi:hypothetical protein
MACGVLLASVLAGGRTAQAQGYVGSETERVERAKGWNAVQSLLADMDQDAKPEVIVIERKKEIFRTSVLSWNGGPDDEAVYRTLFRKETRRIGRLQRFEVRRLSHKDRPDALVVLEELTPDEVVHHIDVFSMPKVGLVQEVFHETFFQPKTVAGEKTKVQSVPFGDAQPRFLTMEGVPTDLAWIKGPQALTVRQAGVGTDFVIGAFRRRFVFDPAQGVYRAAPDEVWDFLPPYRPTEVVATEQRPEIWGTAQAFWSADGDLKTAWRSDIGPAKGAKIRQGFESPKTVRMVRVVPGCAETKSSWHTHREVQAFALLLGQTRFAIDRLKPDTKPKGVRAWGEFPLYGDYASQVVVFLETPLPAKDVVLEVERVSKGRGGAGQEVCVSEWSVH